MEKVDLIKKWLNNDLSKAELEAFNAMEDAALYKEIVAEAQRFSGATNAKVPSYEAFDKKLSEHKNTRTPWLKIISGMAAVLVVGLALFTLINNNKTTSFRTDLAEKEQITLPDNSRVDLNELSELEFNSAKWRDNRMLNLKGEAFFDVEKGKRFDVNTNLGTVSVLGTEFNVLSRDSIFKVSCYEGLVQVSYGNKTIKLPAGTEFLLSSGTGITTNISVAEPYWLKNMSVFKNAIFPDVIKELEKQYNIEVDIPTDISMKFTGAFEHNNLDNALKSITKPLNLTYAILENNKVIIRHEAQ
ncbi:FecR family protein [uncultured Winogradskyella sp.]|uniref:FecR family protein n=1 Tax=uncultured Winogradskyella sp. TaxID=395353 RepID=UPI00351122D5